MRDPRSVLFCISSHNLWGGIESWLHQVMTAHRDAGWTTHFAVARGKRFNIPERFLEHFGVPDALEIDGRTGTSEGRIQAIERVVRKAAPSIVVPLALGHALPALGRLKARGTRVRSVLALHAINAWLLADAEAFAPVIDLVVGVNPLQSEFLRSRVPEERLTVVPNGTASLETVRPARRSGSPVRLLLACRLDELTKRVLDVVPFALELRRRAVEFHVTVAGNGPSEAELRRRVAENGLAPFFELLGYVEPTRLQAEVMPRCDVVILFSPVGEAFALVIVEGMAAGCVVVSSDWPGVRSAGALKAGRNGFLFPIGDVSSAAERVEHLWRHPEELERMSAAALQTGRAFSWARTRELWLSAMEDLLGREPVVSPRGRRFPMDVPSPAGRLDHLPGGLAETLRRVLRRYPDFADGWGEWPGTLTPVSREREAEMLASLAALDRSKDGDEGSPGLR